MKKIRKPAIAVAALWLAGCAAAPAQLQSASSGLIGCTPSDISVSDYQLGISTSTWTATCHNQRYFCSGTDTLKGVNCSKAQ